MLSDEHHWWLSDEGKNLIPEIRSKDGGIKSFARTHQSLRGDALVADTYRRYPYYATRSEIAARVLSGDTEALQRIETSRPAKGHASIATIGYEGRNLESYLNVLHQRGITLLCDVRRNPISRKYGFSKKTLAHACEGLGIRFGVSYSPIHL